MTKLNEISQRVGIDTTSVNKYISVLRELGFVKREIPLTERASHKSRKGFYKIADNYVKFWFRFVLPNRSLIESGHADLVYNEIIAPHLSDYMGHLFEEVCRQYIRLYWDDKLKVVPIQVGAHWESQLEIDVLTKNVDGSHWFGECKWWKKPVGENVLNRLIEKSMKVPGQWKQNPRYVLFSASGFTEALKQRSTAEDILLLQLENLF